MYSLRRYNKSVSIPFRGTKDAFGGLSNMAGGFPVIIGGYKLKNVEALYQSLRYPNMPEVQTKIINYASPIIAKRYARGFVKETRKDWEQVRFKIMRFCIEIKLAQNWDSFSKVLINTRDHPIVEVSKKDKIWGAIDKGDYYEGTNALGRLLMDVRDKIKNTEVYSIDIPDVVNLIFLGYDLTKINPLNGLVELT